MEFARSVFPAEWNSAWLILFSNGIRHALFFLMNGIRHGRIWWLEFGMAVLMTGIQHGRCSWWMEFGMADVLMSGIRHGRFLINRIRHGRFFFLLKGIRTQRNPTQSKLNIKSAEPNAKRQRHAGNWKMPTTTTNKPARWKSTARGRVQKGPKTWTIVRAENQNQWSSSWCAGRKWKWILLFQPAAGPKNKMLYM